MNRAGHWHGNNRARKSSKPARPYMWFNAAHNDLANASATLPVSKLLVQLRPYAGELNADRCVGKVQLWYVRFFEAVRTAYVRATLAGVDQPDVLDSKDNVVVDALTAWRAACRLSKEFQSPATEDALLPAPGARRRVTRKCQERGVGLG